MTFSKQQGYGTLLLIGIIALVSVGLAMTVGMERHTLKAADAEVTVYARQFDTIQNRALSFYKDKGSWPTSLEQLNTVDNEQYNTGINASPAGTGFLFDTSSGWLQIQSNANDRLLAEKVAALVVGGVANTGVVTSTLKNPYEVDAYDDYLQRMENPDDPSRTRLETDLDWNHNELYKTGNVDGESLEFQDYKGEQSDIRDTTVDDKAVVGQNTLTASGRSLNVDTGQFNTKNVGATVMRLAELETGTAEARQYRGDDFSTGDTSVNAIYYEIQALKNELDECMYVTEWCFPKAPKITQTACEPACSLRKESESFSSKIRALVSQCQHGCDYRWSLGSANGSCQSGSISEGGYRRLSCDISGSVPPSSTRSHAIKLTALNSVDTDKNVTKTVPVRWENTKSDNPFEAMESGCFIDTERTDSVSNGGCTKGGYTDSVPPSMTFNVGEIWSGDSGGGAYIFADSTNPVVSWSGCTPDRQEHLCRYYGYTPPHTQTVTVTVTIGGASKTYTITANDQREDVPGGGVIN